MNSESLSRLKIDLHCRMIAIRFSVANLLYFDENENQELQLLLWCGSGYLPGILEPHENWFQVTWDDMPLLSEIYRLHNAEGLSAWVAWRRKSDLRETTIAVRQKYAAVVEMTNAYLNAGRSEAKVH